MAQGSAFRSSPAFPAGQQWFHTAFEVEDHEGAYKRREGIGVIRCEDPETGIPFATAPGGGRLEILPEKK